MIYWVKQWSFVSIYIIYIFPLASLQTEQRTCRFSRIVSPPLDQGMIWSKWMLCKPPLQTAPQILHLFPSLIKTWTFSLSLGSLFVLCFIVVLLVLLSISISLETMSLLSEMYETKQSKALYQVPKCLRYVPPRILLNNPCYPYPFLMVGFLSLTKHL